MAIIDRIFSSHRDNLEITKPYDAEVDDCTSCRVLGSTAFVSLGGYVYFSGMQQLRQQSKAIEMSRSKYKVASRQAGIVGLSATLFALGIYRMVN